MTKKPLWTGGLVLALAASSLTCAPTSQGEDPRRKLLQSWGENVVLPLYRDFETATVVLDTRAGELCAGASPASLAAAQDAWWAARAPWKAAEVFAFGPYKDEPLRLGPKIDFWPGRPESVEMILYGTAPITAASIETAGAAAKGLPAIEYLLYEPGADLVGQFSTFPRRCEYLRALTADLVKRATEMREAWDPAHGNYLGELVEAGRGSTSYSTLQMALGEVVNRMGFTVENIRAEKLGKPLGTTSGGSPQPDKAESRWSGRSLEDIRDNLRGIEQLYFVGETEEQPGLDFYLRERGSFGATMRARLDGAHAALNAIDVPLTQAVVDQPDRVQAAIDRLGELQRFIQVDVIDALGLTVGFNDNDND